MSTHSLATPNKASAANIKIRPAATKTKSDDAALFNRLGDLLADIESGTNKNDQVTALIAACIAEGVNTGKKIIGLVSHFGYNPVHVAKMLEYGTGYGPDSGHWRRNKDGSYSLFT